MSSNEPVPGGEDPSSLSSWTVDNTTEPTPQATGSTTNDWATEDAPHLSQRLRPFQQRRAASTSQLPLSSIGDPAAPQATFASPLRSVLIPGTATASVSANTAQASLSSAIPSSSSAPAFNALVGASARSSSLRSDRINISSNLPVPAMAVNPVSISEKNIDDPDAAVSSANQEVERLQTQLRLSRLFAASDGTTPPALSRDPSHLRALSNLNGTSSDTSTLIGHLLEHGFVEGRHSDISIIAFGHRYQLHKLLLDRAPYFSAAFSGGWVETSKREIILNPEEIDQNISQTAFELAIKRIYGSPILELEEQEAVSLFATASWLGMPDLIESCVDSIISKMHTGNLNDYIQLVTQSNYGRPGDRILASAKALLCRDGWEMPYSAWDKIPSDVIREVIGGDCFFVATEWERWYLACKILNGKLKLKAIEAGLVSEEGALVYPEPSTIRFFAVRFDGSYRRQSGLSGAPHVDEKDGPWVSLYVSPEISPLLLLLDEGIYYTSFSFQQLQQVRFHKDLLGVPVASDRVLSDALWMSSELRERVMNADDDDLDLGLSEAANTTDLTTFTTLKNTRLDGKGKRRATETAEDRTRDPQPSPSGGKHSTRRFWVPSNDISCVMGGTREANKNANAGSYPELSENVRLSANLESTELTWASDFVVDSGKSTSRCHESDSPVRYSKFPPFRFAAEFPTTRSAKEKKRLYSQAFFSNGSFWNLYIQRMATAKPHHLGVYLHRAKDASSDDPVTHVVTSRSVDDRIGALERQMALRKAQQIPRTFGALQSHTQASVNDGRTNTDSRSSEKSAGSEKDVQTSSYVVGNVDLPTPAITRWLASELDDEKLLLANRRKSTVIKAPYIDRRPTINAWFKVFSVDKRGKMLSVYQSAPEGFVISKSWGWKSNALTYDEDSTVEEGERGSKENKLRFMCVVGIM